MSKLFRIEKNSIKTNARFRYAIKAGAPKEIELAHNHGKNSTKSFELCYKHYPYCPYSARIMLKILRLYSYIFGWYKQNLYVLDLFFVLIQNKLYKFTNFREYIHWMFKTKINIFLLEFLFFSPMYYYIECQTIDWIVENNPIQNKTKVYVRLNA